MTNHSVSAYIKPRTPFAEALEYTLKLVAVNQSWKLKVVREESEAVDLNLAYSDKEAARLWGFLTKDVESSEVDAFLGQANCQTAATEVQIGLLPVIFYLVNCCQEINAPASELDQYGRFRYHSSWQCRSEQITVNVVQRLINRFVQSAGFNPRQEQTKIFVSHDIDFLYGSKSEDLIWAAKKWNIGALLKIIFNEIIKNPHWRNIDKVIRLNSEYDIRSTFFWLVNKGRGDDGIRNADYEFKEQVEFLNLIKNSNGLSGLHKSASSMNIEAELKKSGQTWNINRYHYLKFNINRDWDLLSKSGINLDCSLGFAEHYGFRNSYGKPFVPFDIQNNRSFDFVEMPLHVMDATFLYYLKTEPDKIGSTVIDFIEKNRQDCVLSILWHNNYLTDYAYRPLFKAYKQILGYLYENQFGMITPPEIIDQYSMEWSE